MVIFFVRNRRVTPQVVDAGHGGDTTVSSENVERLFVLPLVVAIGGNQATAFREGPPEGRLPGHRLGPGVDHLRADYDVFGPERNQAPAERAQFPLALLAG